MSCRLTRARCRTANAQTADQSVRRKVEAIFHALYRPAGPGDIRDSKAECGTREKLHEHGNGAARATAVRTATAPKSRTATARKYSGLAPPANDRNDSVTATYPIRTISADEIEAFGQVPAKAFLEPWPAEAAEREQIVIELDRTIAAFDGSQMVGSGSIYSFNLAVPGDSVPAAGITTIAVLPSYRRRGILTGLMNHLISDAASRSEPVAILFATESSIYTRFGFGLASMIQGFTLRRGEGRLALGSAASGPGTPRLRAIEPTQAQAQLARVFDAVFAHQPGMLARDDRWWRYLLTDVEALRGGMSPLYCLLAEDDAGPRGYVLYRTKAGWDSDHLVAGQLVIRELYATDPAATAALWTDVLSRDLVGEVSAPTRPADDPLLALLADPRRARGSLRDALWLRLVDVPAALTRRSYSAAADVVLEVIDPFVSANQGRWRLVTAGQEKGGPAACEPTQRDADVRLTVQALGAAYLGGASFGQLAGAGHVAELTPGALPILAAAMSWDRAPYSGMVF
jgi:predicted acetyltransferase